MKGHWAQVAAERTIRAHGDKEMYTVASGITPSGVVHIGNFREIITVDLVKRALEKRGKKVRFIYSWDDYDVFRKIPKDMPRQEELKEQLRKPIVDVFDPHGKSESYARYHELLVEEVLPQVGITPEYLYQHKKYRSNEYAEQMKHALEHTEKIKEILNQYREHPLADDWLPVSMFCPECKKDTITSLKWEGGYILTYGCECGAKGSFDMREQGHAKLKWRVDWPMRWAYEQVDFEPGGKDHSTKGGSFDTGKQIVKELWNREAPTYEMYDFVRIKGAGGKISSSKGNVLTLSDVLEVYEPEVVRYMFAGTRPNREFAISFDTDVLTIYEEFDMCEQIYFGIKEVDEKKKLKQSVAYELSLIGEIPKTIPFQPSFRHLTVLLQIYELDVDRVVAFYEKELQNEHDKRRVRNRATCAKNWLLKYAPQEFRFTVQKEVQVTLSEQEKSILHKVATKVREQEWTPVALHESLYMLCKNSDFPIKDFFKSML